MQHVRVWSKEKFIDWGGPTQKDGAALQFPQIHLKRAQNLGFFYVQGKEEARDKRCVTSKHQQIQGREKTP